jgi:hypothetical protein
MKMKDQLYTLTSLLPERKPLVPTEQEDVWAARTGQDTSEKRKVSYPHQDSNY